MTTLPTFPASESLNDERARELGFELGLRGNEYDRIVDTLGRTPTVSELGMYSVMWSEHCSYKSSKMHLKTLPTDGAQVLVGPGENAGVVDVGGGIAVTFKIESHNHPSFVEPMQGAATGVGGILRDIFTMGARPIAVMDPLRFGDPGGWVDAAGATHLPDALQRRLIDGVVRGVSMYGNCVGVPNIGGETVFDASYAGNPLVNVLAIGVLKHDRLQLARAEGIGHLAVLLGSATGRDGIGGASVLASQEFDEALEAKRPNVQVGDPFAEKLLIECCLALYDAELISGIQDMGAAGIACSTSELASAASLGMRVDLDLVPLRDSTMESWEILCSESQERMLALVAPEHLDAVRAVADRWGVHASVIGEVTDGDELVLFRDGELIAQVPARSLADEGPTYDRPQHRPDWLDDYAAIDADTLDLAVIAKGDVATFVLRFLAWPTVASKHWVFEQYDQYVQSGTISGPAMADAGIVRLLDTVKGVACSTDGNGRWCAIDPAEGTRRVVAEAFRNVACTGARPLATTNCLNFGNPERPEIMWQLATSINAMGQACEALAIPVTGGNVSLYNETSGAAIHPTPVIGVLGVIDDVATAVGVAFGNDGDVIVLLGQPTANGLAASDLQHFLDLPLGGRLAPVDFEMEAAIAEVLREAARTGLIESAHDVASGGLLVTLVESAVAGLIGCDIIPPVGVSPVQLLFSESPGRVVVSLPGQNVPALALLCKDLGVPVVDIGTVGGETVQIGDIVELPLETIEDAFLGGLEQALSHTTTSS
ncbi:MAG: phosphoribosylformylglycinamidine synthase subunit PurL [Nitriliruptoraceae bacterium]